MPGASSSKTPRFGNEQSVRQCHQEILTFNFRSQEICHSGVLTKVDRIEFGGASKWLRMLRGEDQPLMHGWYCVKQRDLGQLQEGITWDEARSFETEFFQTTAPWADLGPSQRSRLGSQKLADRLGAILSDLVSKESVLSSLL